MTNAGLRLGKSWTSQYWLFPLGKRVCLNIHEFLNLKEKIEIYVFSELSQFDTTKIPDKLQKGKGQTTYSLTLDSHT